MRWAPAWPVRLAADDQDDHAQQEEAPEYGDGWRRPGNHPLAQAIEEQ